MAGTIQTKPTSAAFREGWDRMHPEQKAVGGGPMWWCTGCWHWFYVEEDPPAMHRCDGHDQGDVHGV